MNIERNLCSFLAHGEQTTYFFLGNISGPFCAALMALFQGQKHSGASQASEAKVKAAAIRLQVPVVMVMPGLKNRSPERFVRTCCLSPACLL